MATNLVIVESPAKAKTINKILGGDFIVKSSMGHVRDLPERTIGVDIERDFTPKYVLIKTRRKVVDELKKAAAGCANIYLAPDPDREGEAIAWHLQNVLAPAQPQARFLRVQYNEITPAAVRKAFAQPGPIDLKRVDAQQARRVLDRIVGYTVSPMLWRRIQRGLSAGRVQSVALRLVCEREADIRAFVPQPFWLHGALVRKLVDPREPFRVKLTKIDGAKAEVTAAEQSAKILDELQGRAMAVRDVQRKEVMRRPFPPFITSTMQQGASSAFGFTPKRSMQIAQQLYEGVDLGQGPVGLITYMRTDSVQISRDAIVACRAYIEQAFGAPFRPEQPNYYKSRSGAQEAHEAIRPTDVARTPESLAGQLDPALHKLYTLIWKRFVASQMSPAVLDQRTVIVEAVRGARGGGEYLFSATASDIKFPGYMRVTGAEERRKEKEGGEEEDQQKVPEVTVGEALDCLEWLAERKETKPPPRYTETSLVGALEANGIGRPSTYAQIISTLYDREYVEKQNRALAPTPLGEKVSGLLVSVLNTLFDVKFTAGMEGQLDEVEKGHVEWHQMLRAFYGQFSDWMKHCAVPTAPAGHVARVLASLEGVHAWGPEVKRGKRTYSDRGFVESIREQAGKEGGGLTERQFEALLRIAGKYREQAPDIVAALGEIGRAEVVQAAAADKPQASALRKLELLSRVALNEATAKFVESLRHRTVLGRALTPAQVNALNSVVSRNAKQIEGFEQIKGELELDTAAARPEGPDTVSGELLRSMAGVTTWRPATTRGSRVFDDKAFYTSLAEQFERKGFLTDRQRAALGKMLGLYTEQIPGYGELAAKFGLKAGRARKGAEAEANADV